MNLRDYKQLLSLHDWYYSFSDDPHSYDRGLEEENKLKRLAEGKKSYEEAYRKEKQKYFPDEDKLSSKQKSSEKQA